jgi:hypothetical protein
MEQFMLIFHGGSNQENAFASAEAIQAHMGKWIAWVEKLKKSGQYSSGEPLLPGGKLVSGAAGKSVVDGPYTEGKEVVGGYFVIRAKDMDDAVAITKKDFPDFELGGSVQIRPVMKMDNM